MATNDNETSYGVATTFTKLFTDAWDNTKPPSASEDEQNLYKIAETEALNELRRTLDSNAALKLAPEDFMRLYTDMQKIAQETVRETRDQVAKATETKTGSHALRENVKRTVQKFIGSKHGTTHVNCVHGDNTSPKPGTAPTTLSQLCGIDIHRSPSQPLPYAHP